MARVKKSESKGTVYLEEANCYVHVDASGIGYFMTESCAVFTCPETLRVLLSVKKGLALSAIDAACRWNALMEEAPLACRASMSVHTIREIAPGYVRMMLGSQQVHLTKDRGTWRLGLAPEHRIGSAEALQNALRLPGYWMWLSDTTCGDIWHRLESMPLTDGGCHSEEFTVRPLDGSTTAIRIEFGGKRAVLATAPEGGYIVITSTSTSRCKSPAELAEALSLAGDGVGVTQNAAVRIMDIASCLMSVEEEEEDHEDGPQRVYKDTGGWYTDRSDVRYASWEELRVTLGSYHSMSFGINAECTMAYGAWHIRYVGEPNSSVLGFPALCDARIWARDVGLNMRIKLPACRPLVDANKARDRELMRAGVNPKVYVDEDGILQPYKWSLALLRHADDEDLRPFYVAQGYDVSEWCAFRGFALIDPPVEVEE